MMMKEVLREIGLSVGGRGRHPGVHLSPQVEDRQAKEGEEEEEQQQEGEGEGGVELRRWMRAGVRCGRDSECKGNGATKLRCAPEVVSHPHPGTAFADAARDLGWRRRVIWCGTNFTSFTFSPVRKSKSPWSGW